MRKFLTLMISMTVLPCMAGNPEPEKQFTIPGAPESNVQQIIIKNMKPELPFLPGYSDVSLVGKNIDARKSHSNVLGEAGNTVRATLKFPSLNEEWSMPWGIVSVYNDEGFFEEIDIFPYDDDGNFVPTDKWDINIPTGRYDFLSTFRKKNLQNVFQEDHDVYYIAENIEVNEGSVIELKPWESTIHISMETTNPDGEKTRFRKIRYLDEDYNWEIIEEGNITDVYLVKEIYHNGTNVTTNLTNAGGVTVEPGPYGEFNPQDACDFFVNKVSEKYVFRSLRYMPAWPDTENGIYVAVTEAKGSSAGTYINNKEYKLDEDIIKSTPAFAKYPPIDAEGEKARPYSLNIFSYSNGSASGIGDCLSGPEKSIWKIWYAGPEHPVDKGDIYMVYSKMLNDAYIICHSEWGDYVDPKSIEGHNIYPFAPDGASTTASISGNIGWNPEVVFYPYIPFPGNESFMSQLNDNEIPAGGTAPLLISWITPTFNWDTEQTVFQPSMYYCGRLSERLGSTTDLATASLSFNGETVAQTFADAQQYMMENKEQKGAYQLSVTTDNFETEGLKGGNHAVAVWNNVSGSFSSPSATMLQFRDTDNKVVQSFATPEKGRILLSAADFVICEGEPYDWGQKKSWFDPKVPSKVNAWCSAYGSAAEVVNEIILDEQSDGYHTPGFGALYTGSLASVNLPSATGWYDLTIVVEGADGNRQMQTLSPAFKIESMAGIMNVDAETGVRVSDDSIIAPEGSRVFTVSGVETNMTGLAKGVYIVVTQAGTCKIAVK